MERTAITAMGTHERPGPGEGFPPLPDPAQTCARRAERHARTARWMAMIAVAISAMSVAVNIWF